MTTTTLTESQPKPDVGAFAALAGVAVLGGIALITRRADAQAAMAAFPWEILAMYVALDMFAGLLVATGASDLLAVYLARRSKAQRTGILVSFAVLLFTVGGFVNNLTDMLMVLPVAMVLLRAVGLDRRFAFSFFALLLAVSNLSGAATPIGDFPAILILGSGLTSFGSYLTGAFPLFALTTVVLVAIYCLLNRGRGQTDLSSRQFALDILEAKYRHRQLNKPALLRLGAAFMAMFVAWVMIPANTVPPEVIAWAGVAVATVLVGSMVDRTGVKAFDLRPVLYIAAFLFAASMLTTTGFTAWLADHLQVWFSDPTMLVLALMVATSLMCALVSAGPAAAAMLPVLETLVGPGGALQGESDLMAVAFAASICAGSSLFLFSATAGLMLAGKVNDSDLDDADGRPLRFGISSYLPYGFLNYGVQMTIAVVWVLIAL